MTACLVLLWTYDDDALVNAGRVEARCLCGWTTGTYKDTPANRWRLAQRGVGHEQQIEKGAA